VRKFNAEICAQVRFSFWYSVAAMFVPRETELDVAPICSKRRAPGVRRASRISKLILFGIFVSWAAIPVGAQTPPNIAGLSPNSGASGAAVTFNGSNFGATQGSSTLKFGTTVATPTSWNDTQIVALVPSMPNGLVYINLTVNGLGNPTAQSFTVGNPPNIAGLSPNSGPIAAAIVIAGTNFGASQGPSTVSFNGINGMPTAWSNTQITVPVPAGATTGSLVVTVSGLASSGVLFTVGSSPAPVISSISPGIGGIGTTVTIAGSYFGTAQGQSTVTFNNVVAAKPVGATPAL
jgi:hypothetical protein